MYACIRGTGRGSFEGGVRIGESASYFSRPTSTTLVLANDSVPAHGVQ
jgi:hypothetical protein